MKNIYIQLLDILKEDGRPALATIIETKGSTPQIPGASALLSSDGICAGTVGGGTLEAGVQKKAAQSLQQETSLLYELSLTADISAAAGAICGGEATVLIDARPQDHAEVFQSISESLGKRRPGVLITFISIRSGEQISLIRDWVEMDKYLALCPWEELEASHAGISDEIGKSLAENKPNLIEINKDRLLFLEPVYPLPHLIIAGAGHIGQAVSHLGSLLDFEVTVIDDRPEFANRDQLPEADSIIVDDVGEAMGAIPISSDTYIVIVTRGHRSDADTLRQCIGSEAAYIGMIGSARKIGLMREKFLQEGWAASAQWDRVYAPIGIEIQSRTVQEIAVSIVAQLILVRRQFLGKT